MDNSLTVEPLRVPAHMWLLAAAAVIAVYLVTMDNGVLLGHTAGTAHEFFHDARHIVGAPCH